MSQHTDSGPFNTLVLDPQTHWFWTLQHTGSGGPSNTLVLDPPTHWFQTLQLWFWRSLQHTGSGGPFNTLVLEDPPTDWFWTLQHTGSGGPSNTLVLEVPPTHWFWRSIEGLWGLKPFRSSFKSGKTTTLRLFQHLPKLHTVERSESPEEIQTTDISCTYFAPSTLIYYHKVKVIDETVITVRQHLFT